MQFVIVSGKSVGQDEEEHVCVSLFLAVVRSFHTYLAVRLSARPSIVDDDHAGRRRA